MDECLYLIYRYYDIGKNDTAEEIIFKSARKSYKEFWRRVILKDKLNIDRKDIIERNVENLLCCKVPFLLEAKSQKEFDEQHNKICLQILQCYKNVGKVSYGIAQRWLNQTLLNLVVIESILQTKHWNIDCVRKYFHIPVENSFIKAATFKSKSKPTYELNLKCAPLKHNSEEKSEMSCYRLGKMQPFELWTYAEYIRFQKNVKEEIEKRGYKDTVDWTFDVALASANGNM